MTATERWDELSWGRFEELLRQAVAEGYRRRGYQVEWAPDLARSGELWHAWTAIAHGYRNARGGGGDPVAELRNARSLVDRLVEAGEEARQSRGEVE